ncbi:MAG: hypothetical protein JWQ34_2107 [Mucilaginibacter sp.]|uniref:hypothetical protein n=1 Tax=Mucilaginibacter sp. TaxID=1882438 RepID=UPI00262788AF|nr:hypothetical protein [Mucilaginibacter sp.]MDB5003882.1 hypothetical protein [Mucilaginibacter sp.]
MKKILLSTVVLTAFSLSIILFEISCKKSADAATTTSTSITQQNKIIYTKNLPLSGSSGTYYCEIWVANYDGSNPQKISISLPSGLFVSYTTFVKLSPDQKTIFFNVDDTKHDTNGTGFYSSNIDGSNAKLIIANSGNGGTLEVAY